MLALLLLLVITQTWGAPGGDDGMHPRFPPSRNAIARNPDEQTIRYWQENAQKTVQEKISRKINQNIAKNVILFLGDGMSIPTISASRVYYQGEEAQLSFDKFPYTALSKTYAVDRQVSDSASTSTAYLGGSKANYGTIGVGPAVSRGDCQSMANVSNHVLSIAYYSQLVEKKTGLVTTARVTHASPGGVFAHTAERDWECDSDVISLGADPQVCTDIATQLVYGETGKNLNVILGGGRGKWFPKNVTDGEGYNGSRSDGRDLIQEWISLTNGQYVWNRDQLLALGDTNDLLGLFATEHMDFNTDRDASKQPSLAEMTLAAIQVLDNPNGYFLFVEGARIDSAHHHGTARKALNDTLEFSKAIEAAVNVTSEEDTLIVVTADHAHTMSYSGYAERGNDILEFGGDGSDGKVYMTLNYANGKGYHPVDADGSRHDVTQDDYTNKDYVFPALAPRKSDSHGGDDVGVFARGPWAHLFTGVIEQNVIPHLMSYASCVGEGITACDV